jgi:F0F1-type ATP synthase membrane subunit c/vacuolar-type H+-ATPase subunit K
MLGLSAPARIGIFAGTAAECRRPTRGKAATLFRAPTDGAASRRLDTGANQSERSREMRKLFEIGGLVAAAVLIAFGVAAIVLGVNGRDTVGNSLKQEYIVGTPDMTASAIAAEAKKAGLPASIKLPTANIAGKAITNGTLAHEFATYMRIHTLEATGGLSYAQMGRYKALATAPAKFTDGLGGTNDTTYAVTDPKIKQPVSNPRRDIWTTSVALQTALNSSYMADQLSVFGVVVGVALLLSGFGFGILAVGGALRNPETALGFVTKRFPHTPPKAPTVRTA